MNNSCGEEPTIVSAKYQYSGPQYDQIQLISTSDTINFPLNENTFNAIKSFNVFIDHGSEYISFYDRLSESINIYHFKTQRLIKKILLKHWFSHQKLYNTTVYVKSFDSLFINNQFSLNIMDSSGNIKSTYDFQEKPYVARASFDNITPLVIKNSFLFAKARCYMKESSLSEFKKWRVLYSFDLHANKGKLFYSLPETYQKNNYSYSFFDYSYCYNNHKNFVFSFPADSNIYESDLESYHISYFGKSMFQRENIKSVSKENLTKNSEVHKSYLTSFIYGPIYFDAFARRYLRVAKSEISNEDYNKKYRRRKQYIILFDEDFRIIGESQLADDMLLNALFFTQDGNMYVRVKPKDENALHFVKLIYDNNTRNNQLTENKK